MHINATWTNIICLIYWCIGFIFINLCWKSLIKLAGQYCFFEHFNIQKVPRYQMICIEKYFWVSEKTKHLKYTRVGREFKFFHYDWEKNIAKGKPLHISKFIIATIQQEKPKLSNNNLFGVGKQNSVDCCLLCWFSWLLMWFSLLWFSLLWLSLPSLSWLLLFSSSSSLP